MRGRDCKQSTRVEEGVGAIVAVDVRVVVVAVAAYRWPSKARRISVFRIEFPLENAGRVLERGASLSAAPVPIVVPDDRRVGKYSHCGAARSGAALMMMKVFIWAALQGVMK